MGVKSLPGRVPAAQIPVETPHNVAGFPVNAQVVIGVARVTAGNGPDNWLFDTFNVTKPTSCKTDAGIGPVNALFATFL
ncbi:hypothetical protein HK098_002684 [Nowakowskiella sp. JEL0407]|nr:hypothetical protein HK098_002684 [Nowakowskiella sp. JEL0407]